MKPTIHDALRAYGGSMIVGLFFILQPAPGQAQNSGGSPHQRGPLPPEAIIERFDTDGNGTLSESEMPPRMAPAFNAFDTDGNNQVSVEELEAQAANNYGSTTRAAGGQQQGQPLPPDEIIERFDADDNGTLSESEMPPRLAPAFKSLDTDSNNQVSAEELAGLEQKRR